MFVLAVSEFKSDPHGYDGDAHARESLLIERKKQAYSLSEFQPQISRELSKCTCGSFRALYCELLRIQLEQLS